MELQPAFCGSSPVQVISAFNATTLKKIYTSGKLPSPLPHFANLVVVNGKVYIGTNNSLVVYGLL